MSPEQHESLFIQHAQWFKHHFATGTFVLLGPYSDQQRAGLVIANVEHQDELTAILREDAYYPDLATYEVREFIPKMIAENLHQLQKA
ncbi:YciI family protein [Phytobacter sp. V91]|uniref:YciI family protein n=1 Tax=Phytobacter sp. V91 TaxID=3369425 RepID=UPI003F60E102